MTARSARTWVVALVAAVVLPLAFLLVKNALVRHTIHRITARGGMVLSWTDASALNWMPSRLRSHAEDLFVLRTAYDVRLGVPEIGCGTGITLSMWDESHPPDDGDGALAALPDLGKVVQLEARKVAVTDAGLRPVGALPGLTFLLLEETAVTGTGLSHLRGLPLVRLSLEGSPVDDTGLAALGGLPALEWLRLSATRVTGPGLSHLSRLPRLAALDLSRTPVGDEALRYLAGLHLTSLGLADTAVSDAGLAHLERLAGLERLWLCGSRVSREAVARSPSKAVRASLGSCQP